MRTPAALRLGLAGGAAAAAVLALLRAWTRRVPVPVTADEPLASTLVAIASDVVAFGVAALLAAGALALRRRPGTRIGLLLFGAGAMLVAAVARPVYEHLIAPDRPDYLSVLSGRRWVGRVDVTGAVAFAAGVITLAEHTPRGRNLAVPLLVLAVLAHPPLAVRDGLTSKLADHAGSSSVWTAGLVLAAIQIGFAAIALSVIDDGLRSPRQISR
jgi:hypothetical protein